MRRASLLAAAIIQLACLALSASELPAVRCRQLELARDPAVLRTLWDLLARNRYGFANVESAEFIVRDARCEISSVRWPVSSERDRVRWSGSFPEGTIAIAHTHPNSLPSPSLIDIATARRLHVPFFVLTRTRVTMTDGKGVWVVAEGDWRPKAGVIAEK